MMNDEWFDLPGLGGMGPEVATSCRHPNTHGLTGLDWVGLRHLRFTSRTSAWQYDLRAGWSAMAVFADDGSGATRLDWV